MMSAERLHGKNGVRIAVRTGKRPYLRTSMLGTSANSPLGLKIGVPLDRGCS